MKTVVYFTGKTNRNIEIDIPVDLFEDEDVSELYNIFIQLLPGIDTDFLFEKINYYEHFIECFILTY